LEAKEGAVAQHKEKIKRLNYAKGGTAEPAVVSFKLPIGNKRQVTIPSKAMELLSLEQGDDLILEIAGEYAVLHPAVSVPRHELPEELWKKFAARRGAKPTDIPLKTLLEDIGYRPKAPEQNPEQKLREEQEAENARMAKLYREQVLGEKPVERSVSLDLAQPVSSPKSSKSAFRLRAVRAGAGSGNS
jgi:bifunctional DNA-binding transcriptional regulator/antitoxin component of YhaV-PrlF toxin-antitoxin module